MNKAFILFLLSINIFAQDYLSACFVSELQAKQALKKLNFIKTNTDSLQQISNCVDIQSATHRIPLFEKFLMQKFGRSVNFNSQIKTIVNQNCELELVTTKKIKTNNQSAKVDNGVDANASQNIQESKSTSTLYIQSGQYGSMTVDGQSLNIHCSVRGDGYDLKIQSASQTNSINTSRFIKKGASIDLGSLVSSQNDKNQQVGLKKVNIDESRSSSNVTYILTAK